MPQNPEYRGRKEPEPGGQPPEGEPLPYYLAARFTLKEKALSQKVYMQAQEVIRTTDCDLSTYRFLVPQQLTQPRPWYVVTIGETPPDAVHQQMTTILAQGEMTSLPDQAREELSQRRAEQIKKGSWVEAHYKPTLKKKEKRNQQKQSRRRNRGK